MFSGCLNGSFLGHIISVKSTSQNLLPGPFVGTTSADARLCRCRCQGLVLRFLSLHVNIYASCVIVTGQEIYLRPPSNYQLPDDTECTFQQLSELCRLRQETAIGFIAKEGGVELSPSMRSTRRFCNSDRIIVLADSGPAFCSLDPSVDLSSSVDIPDVDRSNSHPSK